MEQDKILAVMGSPGSGKTTVAVRLAKYLADKRRNVILLLCDMTAPMLPCICPAADLECERSLGSVLAAAHVSENLVKNTWSPTNAWVTSPCWGCSRERMSTPTRLTTRCRRGSSSTACGRSLLMWSLTAAVTSPTTSSPLWRSWSGFRPAAGQRRPQEHQLPVQPTSPPAGCQMGYGQAVQDRQQCKVPAGRGSHESGAGDSGLHAAPFGGAGGTVSGRQPAGGPIHEGQPGIPQGDREDCQGGVWVLGEKRSQSLFAPKASAEKAAATHITTGPDGRKKELPLYFGPDCPVSGNMGQNQHEAGVGEPQPADEPLRHAPADDGTGVEADPTDSVNMAEDLPRRSLNTESAGGYRRILSSSPRRMKGRISTPSCRMCRNISPASIPPHHRGRR